MTMSEDEGEADPARRWRPRTAFEERTSPDGVTRRCAPDEPVFVLRAHDGTAVRAIGWYVQLLRFFSQPDAKVQAVIAVARAFKAWPEKEWPTLDFVSDETAWRRKYRLRTAQEELAEADSILNRAADDEPVFVLRARDPLASLTVLWWAQNSVGAGGGERKYNAALDVALGIERWRSMRLAPTASSKPAAPSKPEPLKPEPPEPEPPEPERVDAMQAEPAFETRQFAREAGRWRVTAISVDTVRVSLSRLWPDGQAPGPQAADTIRTRWSERWPLSYVVASDLRVGDEITIGAPGSKRYCEAHERLAVRPMLPALDLQTGDGTAEIWTLGRSGDEVTAAGRLRVDATMILALVDRLFNATSRDPSRELFRGPGG